MSQRTDLADFLQSRRGRLTPEEVGLVNYGERRRVPGLRREELAQLAGVSVSYYTRLEQGQGRNVSDEVLDAIARSLRLSEEERRYLRNLARPARTPRRAPKAEHVSASLRMLVESLAETPALVLGRSTDVLAWNRLGHALLASHLDPTAPTRPADRPNLTRMVFLDPPTRELYADWRLKSRGAVEHLRSVAGRYPDDPRLTALIGELSVRSQEFAALWAAHRVCPCPPIAREFRHPLVGSFSLFQQTLRPMEDEGQMVVMLGAEPGSPSEAALHMLSCLTPSWDAPAEPAGATPSDEPADRGRAR
jgi:transcriptional regulator with XRE-family HTH domain